MANAKEKSSKVYTAQDAKKRIEAERKKDPAAFKKKYGGKMPNVEK